MSHYAPIDPKREGTPCMSLACMATIDGHIWLGWNDRERDPKGGTRSLGTEWTERLGKSTRKAWVAAERVIADRNAYSIRVV